MMAVTRYAVGLEVVRCLGKQRVDLRLAACAADARFGVGNQMLAGIALLFCTTLLIKMKRERYVWITLIPADLSSLMNFSYTKGT